MCSLAVANIKSYHRKCNDWMYACMHMYILRVCVYVYIHTWLREHLKQILILFPSMTIIFKAFNMFRNMFITDHSWKSILCNKLGANLNEWFQIMVRLFRYRIWMYQHIVTKWVTFTFIMIYRNVGLLFPHILEYTKHFEVSRTLSSYLYSISQYKQKLTLSHIQVILLNSLDIWIDGSIPWVLFF